MKKASVIHLLMLLAAINLMYSCSKSSVAPASVVADTLITTITNGTWKITSITQPGENNTSKFSTYVFSFTQDGKINAVSNGKTSVGSWAWSGTSYYGVNNSKPIFTISLGADEPLRRLTHNWVVENKSPTSIQFGSSEPLENEHVIFEKQ